MNLLGWDTTSALDISLVNQSLEAEQDRLVSQFRLQRDDMKLQGFFGPWQIVKGGSMRLLHMDMHIRSGQARKIRTRGNRPIELGGMILHVEIPLRMVPSPDGTTPARLRFIVGADDPEDVGAITALGLTDPHDRVDAMESELLQIGLTDCLSAHLDKVSYVFAEIAPHKGGSWAAMPYLDWASLQTGDGRAYLAIFGALREPTAKMEPDKIDPELIAGEGTAYHAFSTRLYMEKVLVPWLNDNFSPKTRFAAKGNSAGLAAGPVRLPPVSTGLGQKTPYIMQLNFKLQRGGLAVSVKSTTDIGADVYVHATVGLFMPFTMDPKTGSVGLRPDPKPKVKTWTEGRGIFGGLTKAVADLLIGLSGTNLSAIATNTARKMQSMNTPVAQPVTWTGTRGFKATKAIIDGAILVADTRPV